RARRVSARPDRGFQPDRPRDLVERLRAGYFGSRVRVGVRGFDVEVGGFCASRALSLPGSWRLAGAALMPGALFLCAAIFLYGWGALDLVRLSVATAVHVVMSWIYLIVSPLCSPRRPAAAAKENPFA